MEYTVPVTLDTAQDAALQEALATKMFPDAPTIEAILERGALELADRLKGLATSARFQALAISFQSASPTDQQTIINAATALATGSADAKATLTDAVVAATKGV